ncbi:MAG TPA: CBS domain-containing protein [Nitrososphaeraceae archaeon]|jgi:CBS domain-containing protein|nr:CBS domain-containing protein [Nitrososphaeraceae archaeon]HEU5172235.1 CBS domain-containing protein [Nitrososphaeraceae archaeon]
MEGNEKSIQVQMLMTSIPVQTATSEDTIEAISNKMKENQVGSIVVVNEKNHPLGIVTERDIVRKVIADGKDPKTTKVDDIKTTSLITIDPETNLHDAALIMTKYRIRRLPVVKDNTLYGIITSDDLVRYLYEKNKKDPMLAAMGRFKDIEELD